MKWFKLGSMAAVLAIVALLAFGSAAFAQGPAPTPQAPTYGPMGGMGGRWGGTNTMGGPQNSLISVAAKTLGIEFNDLWAKLNAGQTIADVAKEKGVALTKIVDAFVAPRVEMLKASVEAKRITQAQADEYLKALKENITKQLQTKYTPGQGMPNPPMIDQNKDGICDVCGANPPANAPRMGGRGRWNR